MLADLLLPGTPHLRFDAFTMEADRLTVQVTSTQREVACPSCAHPSQRVHSRYRRTVADLAWAGRQVSLHLQVRRFYCPNPTCPRTTFSERLPTIVAPSARRTEFPYAPSTVWPQPRHPVDNSVVPKAPKVSTGSWIPIPSPNRYSRDYYFWGIDLRQSK